MAGLGQQKTGVWKVILEGLRPALFDRYPGDNKTELPPPDKVYKDSKGFLVLPVENLLSFLTATNTTSAPKRLLDKREYKDVCSAFLSFVDIQPDPLIPFTRNGKPIHVGQFDGDVDEESGIRIDHRVARLEKGIPNPKSRPMLPTPWELAFTLTLYKNPEVNEALLRRMFEDGGIVIGIGTFRGRYGKFQVAKWEDK